MMPTIRVDDDVFQGLKSLAEPFTDTPNSVIRRLLADKGALSAVGKRDLEKAPSTSARKSNESSSALTPQTVYEEFLHYVLGTTFKGKGEKHEVTKAVIDLMRSRGFIGPADLERVSTGETKAENTIAWGRNALKERGFVSRQSRRGVWALTPEGIQALKSISLPEHKG